MRNPSSLIIYLQQIFLDSGRREKPGVSLPIEPVSQWTIPEKKTGRRGGLTTYSFKKTLCFLAILLYPWKFLTNQAFSPRNPTRFCYTPQKF